MRSMLILIKREVVDHIGYFVAAAVVAGLVVVAMAAASADFDNIDDLGIVIVSLIGASVTVVPGLCALGVSQMYADRNRNISAFLMALPVTRLHLFIARVVAGLLAAALLVVPGAVAAWLTIDFRDDEFPTFQGLMGNMFWGVLLACLACYSIGLYTGWNRRSLAPTLAVLPVVFLVPTLVIIKGFGLELVVVLSILIIACLTAAWCRFSASSL